MRRLRLAGILLFALALVLIGRAQAQAEPAQSSEPLLFFWGVGCPHCEAAKPFVERLGKEQPGRTITWIEVRRDPAGRTRYGETVRALGIQGAGIPLFVVGKNYVVGYGGAETDEEVRALLVGEAGSGEVVLPWPVNRRIDPKQVPLLSFTLVVGLLDSANPCAIWVLLVLLGILLHERSRLRLLLFGGIFVVASGVVYFLFMTAWLGFHELTRFSRPLAIGLGVALVVMGLVNLKELVWFKRGVSLVIPERAKPGLFRRMRQIAGAASLPVALLGIAVLAVVVNFVELGCTLGLPAVYTRVLAQHAELSAGGRYGYLALYNLVYVTPLGLIVLVYGSLGRRLVLTERRAKALKGLNGVLLVGLGLLFILTR